MHATAPRPIAFPVVPVVRNRRPQTAFRGTRTLTGLVLGFAGLVAVAFGGVAVPLASAVGLGAVDRPFMDALTRLAPYLVVLGALHLVAAVGVWTDRRYGYILGTWMVASGVLFATAGLVMALAGRDPFALTTQSASASPDGIGILLWTLAWYGVAGWGIQRIVIAREG
jgi:hypothetical protein